MNQFGEAQATFGICQRLGLVALIFRPAISPTILTNGRQPPDSHPIGESSDVHLSCPGGLQSDLASSHLFDDVGVFSP